MANNTFNNDSIFNGDASFNSGITASNVTANTTINTPTVSLNYSSVPSLTTSNIGYVYNTNIITGNYPSGGEQEVFTLNTTTNNLIPGYYIVILQINVVNFNASIGIFVVYNGGGTVSQTPTVTTYSDNGSIQQTVQGTFFINLLGGGVSGFITSILGYSVQSGGQAQLIRIA